jgi:predicted transglutaminase-like cysteine proteinase
MMPGALPPNPQFARSLVSPALSGQIPASTMMRAGTDMAAPSGFVDFCKRNPGQCAYAPAPAVTLSPQVWRALEDVNAAWNNAVKPEDDAAHYGQADYWTIPTDGYGDCEDYALGKRKSLMDAGLPAADLRVALVQTPGGTSHAVLTVSTNGGDYVLDNLNPEIRPWRQINYSWVARQSEDPSHWVSVDRSDNVMLASSQVHQ